jgi:hypothetical protein
MSTVMPAAAERIGVRTTSEDKAAMAAKARRLPLSISELMRRGALLARWARLRSVP